ncbi:growth/differentiation factor 9 [Thalassophryne amazonica]|uniref:growth/differentiation factor 9 n=1 Tax=Thalassophryne amazonica TaxID=390379 RepID=UPI0014715096|nr:growth/differentiation factor 9 [Thalassophryne amazonica]
MEKQTSVCVRAVLLLLLALVTCPLRAVHSLDQLTQQPYDSIFSPLFRALSEHGGSRWNPGLVRKIKPEHRYVRYLTDVYKSSSREKGSADGNHSYNTIRLIKPREECFTHSHEENFTQAVSYNLDQVKRKERLLKSALLYNFDHAGEMSLSTMCYLSVTEQEHSDQCRPCPDVLHAVNFTGRRNKRNWVEVDVTAFLQPLLKFQKKTLHLLINITCLVDQSAMADGHKEHQKFTIRSPPLLLYLHDASKTAHQRSASVGRAGPKASAALNAFHKRIIFKTEHMMKHKRRWKRHSPKSQRGDKTLNFHLPELLPSSEFPTSECALYDFRVHFSQLKLDHWIVFPPKYNPRFCRGICPRTLGFMYGSPVHTMLQNIIYEKLDSSVPRPSCIPSHYSPLSVMIFQEDGSYVYKEFADMIATRCTCR